jgi:hypothetical protein
MPGRSCYDAKYGGSPLPAFLCRWPNGEFSIVSAPTKADAIEDLDEFGNADHAQIWKLDRCLVDFRIDDDGEMQVNSFGEVTEEVILHRCYPELAETMLNANYDPSQKDCAPAVKEEIRRAVEHERNRLSDDSRREAKPAATELGRSIQRQLDCASVVADRAVQRGARERLKSEQGEGRGPH